MTRLTGQTPTCLVVGGGLSGLMAATVLSQQGWRVTVLDKGRGIGGRLASRRISHPLYGLGVFDYGAQFLTVTDARFQPWMETWLREGLMTEWSQGLSPTDLSRTCYRGVASLRTLTQHLARPLRVHLETRAIALHRRGSQWHIQTQVQEQEGPEFSADFVVLTPPIPQTLELLAQSEVMLPEAVRSPLEQVRYHSCIAVLALLEQPSHVPEPGGLRLENGPLAWIGCNRRKGISPEGWAVTLHASSAFSQDHWDQSDTTLSHHLLDVASPWIGRAIATSQLHRWRYSQPQISFSISFPDGWVRVGESQSLILCGDGFAGTTVDGAAEGAALSGLAAAYALIASEDSGNSR